MARRCRNEAVTQQPIKRICLVGATGLVGRTLIEEAIPRPDVRIVAVARREMPLPYGARMELLVAPTQGWPEAIAATNAGVMICALGTTMRKAGDKEAFRAVDHDLVLACGRAAREAGIGHMIAVSSIGADRASSNFYLQTKGETEEALGKLGFRRLDILRPGLIIGRREDRRPLEWAGQVLAPLADRLLLHGKYRRYRSIHARALAQAVFAFAHEKAQGRFVHEDGSIRFVLRRPGYDQLGD